MKRKSLQQFLIISYSLIAIVVAVVISAVSINYIRSVTTMAYNNYKNAMNEGYNREIKSQVQSSIAILEHFYTQETSYFLRRERYKTSPSFLILFTTYYILLQLISSLWNVSILKFIYITLCGLFAIPITC